MKRFKEKLKCMWHILIDSQYIVFTKTKINANKRRLCAIISDNSSEQMLTNTLKTIAIVRKSTYTPKRLVGTGVKDDLGIEIMIDDLVEFWIPSIKHTIIGRVDYVANEGVCILSSSSEFSLTNVRTFTQNRSDEESYGLRVVARRESKL